MTSADKIFEEVVIRIQKRAERDSSLKALFKRANQLQKKLQKTSLAIANRQLHIAGEEWKKKLQEMGAK